MPNTKSAERRARSSATKQLQNRRIKTRLKTLERNFIDLAQTEKKDEAAVALRAVTSALDKAAKTGAVHHAKADRKKSRLALHLNRASKPSS